ncbi:GNAT family N-acetyltransferase [Sphaerisporangium sp. NPDC051017]|uniref:GNAT family N-acetyltransferase n=1 Tax=Sphaerisporangium sp. NPDC051017 TaxID=3154636 RepID=UPI0034444753
MNNPRNAYTFVIRKATEADCPGIVDVGVSSGERFELRDYQLGEIPECLEVFIAEDHAGRLVGWLEGSFYREVDAPQEHPPPHAYIEAVAVAPCARRRGVARCLIAEFVKASISEGLTWIALTPMHGDDEGIAPRVALFTAVGLRPVDPSDPREGMAGALSDVAAVLLEASDSSLHR